MNQKQENLLNLALETSESERERTENLNVGYQEENDTWEVIVKYHGDLQRAAVEISVEIRVEILLASYAILRVPAQWMTAVSALEEIEYMELPKRYYYDMDFGEPRGSAQETTQEPTPEIAPRITQGADVRLDACLTNVVQGMDGLRGKGVLVLVADSGIDWKRREFRKADGTTRILYLWDQVLEQEYDAADINQALQATNAQEQFERLPSLDISGHGTAVAGILAGANPESGYSGVAGEASLLIVKLGVPTENRFPRTTEVMRAVTWGLRKAEELQMPLVINLSLGNSYGAHDGSSLVERFVDNAAEIGRTVICVGSGNEGANGGHVQGRVKVGISTEGATRRGAGGGIGGIGERSEEEFAVAGYETNLRMQIWQNYSDIYRIYLRSPGGQRLELTAPIGGGKFTAVLEQTKILAYQGEPTPYSVSKELYLEFLPDSGNYINSGIWTLEMEPVRVVMGRYDLYMSDGAIRNRGTKFLTPSPQATLTIPSTATKVITVGAYDSTYQAYADFSGRGYQENGRIVETFAANFVKPDLVAPGVGVAAPNLFGSYGLFTGTSFATPIVAGASALLMEWGIVRGNDPFLYGEKIKAYLRAGARPLRGEPEIPNEKVGFGALCVQDSLPL